ERAARPPARRRRAAGTEDRRAPRRGRAGHSSEADERPRYRREAFAAGPSLLAEGQRQSARRAYLDDADPARRVGRDATARSVRQPDDTRQAGHGASDARAL